MSTITEFYESFKSIPEFYVYLNDANYFCRFVLKKNDMFLCLNNNETEQELNWTNKDCTEKIFNTKEIGVGDDGELSYLTLDNNGNDDIFYSPTIVNGKLLLFREPSNSEEIEERLKDYDSNSWVEVYKVDYKSPLESKEYDLNLYTEGSDFVDGHPDNEFKKKVEEFLKEDEKNIAFLFENNWYLTSIQNIIYTLKDNSLIRYECITDNKYNDSNNIIRDPKDVLFLTSSITGSSNLCYLSQIKTIIYDNPQRYYAFVKSDKFVNTIVNVELFHKPNANIFSGDHCQPGKGGPVYNIVSLIPKKTPEIDEKMNPDIKPLKELTSDEVEQLMKSLQLPNFANLCKSKNINGVDLQKINTDNDIKNYFGEYFGEYNIIDKNLNNESLLQLIDKLRKRGIHKKLLNKSVATSTTTINYSKDIIKLNDMTVIQVVKFFNSLDFHEFAKTCKEYKLDGRFLNNLDNVERIKDLNNNINNETANKVLQNINILKSRGIHLKLLYPNNSEKSVNTQRNVSTNIRNDAVEDADASSNDNGEPKYVPGKKKGFFSNFNPYNYFFKSKQNTKALPNEVNIGDIYPGNLNISGRNTMSQQANMRGGSRLKRSTRKRSTRNRRGKRSTHGKQTQNQRGKRSRKNK
jgi:hypothetical protein